MNAGTAQPKIVDGCAVAGPAGQRSKRAELLQKLGLETVDDALSYFPWRYEDRGNLKRIGQLAVGTYETVSGRIVSADVVSTKRKRVKIFELVVSDGSGMLVGSWFNQPFMKKVFREGQTVILSGVVKSNPYRGGLPQCVRQDQPSDAGPSGGTAGEGLSGLDGRR